MTDEGARWNWHDQRGVTWAAGVAAVALIGLLVFAVVRTSSSQSRPPGVLPASSSQTPSSSSAGTEPTSTSYGVPSVQTSEFDPALTPTASTEVPVPQQEDPTTTATTNPTNPYVTTTTQNGGAV